MERRTEQTVSGGQTAARRALYVGAWALMVLLALGMLICAAGVLRSTADGRLTVNWLRLGLLAVLGGSAFQLWRAKDALRLEYDYALWDGTLEVHAILNAKRRKRRLKLSLTEVADCGCAWGAAFQRAQGQPGLKRHDWCLNADAKKYYFCYAQGGERHMALLELDADLAAAVRADRTLNPGAWHDEEGKTSINGSIS